MSRTIWALTEPTSDTIAPGARCSATSRATAPHWPTGMQKITRSAPATAAALVSTTWSAMPSSMTRRRVAAERAVATMLRTTFWARAARAIEEPISPTPMSARRSNSGSAMGRGRRSSQELRQRRDHEAIGLLGADAHAQRIRQAISADLAQDQAAGGEELVRLGRGRAGVRKVDE